MMCCTPASYSPERPGQVCGVVRARDYDTCGVAQGNDNGSADRVIDVLSVTAATDPEIDLVVLFGSVARGEDRADSDVDVIVDGSVTKDFAAWTQLRGHLLEQLERPVGLLSVREAQSAPEVLVSALKEGRVIKDVAGRWSELVADLSRFEAQARARLATYPSRKAAALARLTEGRSHE
jgi:predicted nucleotidyltransferase